MEDHWPSTDCCYLVSVWVRTGGEREGDGGEGGGDEGAGVSESWRVVSIAAGTTTSDADQTCACACEVRTRVSKDETFHSKAEMVLCAAACCACNEVDNSTGDSS